MGYARQLILIFLSMSSSNCSWLGIFKLPQVNCSVLQNLLHVIRAASALKSILRWKMTDTMIEEHFQVFIVKVIATKVISMDTEITDNRDLSF